MGHVQDLWYTTGARGTRRKTPRHGTGQRYRVRYRDASGREHSSCFPDGCKRQAQQFLNRVERERATGDYCDPGAGSITLREYTTQWLRTQTFEESSREVITRRITLHLLPHLGDHLLSGITPEAIRTWLKTLHDRGLAASYRLVILTHTRTILNAALADGRIRKNPATARSVPTPRPDRRLVRPWPPERVRAVRDALPPRYQLAAVLGAGCGLRQGETFGLADTDINTTTSTLTITRQVKIVHGVLCYGPPKGGRTRIVPCPPTVLAAITTHQQHHPWRPVTLPWRHPGGPPVTATLLLTTPQGNALRRPTFVKGAWNPALTRAGITPTPRSDGFHALRHFYASTLLDAGESITALADYLGHHDPAFTLRVYCHLLPASHDRTRTAIDTHLTPPHGTPAA